jgi:hypothetical protein
VVLELAFLVKANSRVMLLLVCQNCILHGDLVMLTEFPVMMQDSDEVQSTSQATYEKLCIYFVLNLVGGDDNEAFWLIRLASRD